MREFELKAEIKDHEEKKDFFEKNGMIELAKGEEKIIETLKKYL